MATHKYKQKCTNTMKTFMNSLVESSKEKKLSGWGRNIEFKEIEKYIASLTQSADKLVQKAEGHGAMTLIASSNALCPAAK
ncbi:hypothetical protein PR048_012842, partial [Dryococelus australis]